MCVIGSVQEERQQKMLMKSSVALNGECESKPSICEASRRLAEKAAGLRCAGVVGVTRGAEGRSASAVTMDEIIARVTE